MKSRITNTVTYLILCLVILLSSTRFATAIPRAISKNFEKLEDSLNSGIDLYIDRGNLEHDISTGDFDLNLFFDGRLLLKEKQYPQNIKLEVYTMIEGKKDLITILNRTVKSNKASENILMLTRLPRLEESAELFFDIYDTHNILTATFSTEIEITIPENLEMADIESVPNYACDNGDGECLIEYLLRHVTFSASYDRNLKTEVVKNDKGRYFVYIPVKKGRTLKSKVRGFNVKNGGKTSNNNGGNGKDPYPYFENNVEMASSFWDEVRDAIVIDFENNTNVFRFKKDASFQINTDSSDGYINIAAGTTTKAPIVFSQGQLLTSPVDGALEYDGSNLYFTKGSTRQVLGAGSGATGPQGPAGPQGPPGPAASGIDLSNGGFLNGTINFINNSVLENTVLNGSLQYRAGANNGLVLTSDANGNASWQSITILVNSTILSTGPIGAVQFAGTSNGFDNDAANFFWDDSNNRLGIGMNTPQTRLDINGDITIRDGSQADGFVLTSNANGQASWQDLTTLTSNGDNLGNHRATTTLNMQNNTINNIGSIAIGSGLTQGAELYIKSFGGNGTTIFNEMPIATGFAEYVTLGQNSNGISLRKWSFGSHGDSRSILTGGPNSFYIFQHTDNSDNLINRYRFAIDDNGYIGIGLFTPSSQLDIGGGNPDFIDGNSDLLVRDDVEVDGMIYTNGLSITTGAVDGFVLSSNANGLASWRALSSFGVTANGTTGSIQFANGVGGFDSDPSSFHWDKTNNRLGINTASPAVTLDINGGVATVLRLPQQNASRIEFGSGNYSIRYSAANALQYVAQNTVGYLGHQFYGSGFIGSHFTVNTATDRTTETQIGILNNGVIGQTIIGSNGQIANLSEWQDFNGTNLAVISKEGRLGLGISSPSEKLEVNGSMIVHNTISFGPIFDNTSGTTINIDWNEGNKQSITLAHAVTTVNFTDPPGPASCVLIVTQDGTGSRTIAGWPGNVLWSSGGIAPTLTAAPGSIDAVSCIYNGTNYLCQAGFNFQ